MMSDSDRERDASAVAASLRTPTSSSRRQSGARDDATGGSSSSAGASSSSSARQKRGKRKRSRNNNNNGGSSQQVSSSSDAASSSTAALPSPPPPPAKKKASDVTRSNNSNDARDATTASAAPSAAATDDGGNHDDDEEPQWGCPACTFLNDAVRSFCEMCGTTNPSPKRLKRSSAGVLGALFAGSPDAHAPWSCVACTMTNPPGMRMCAVCGTVNPQASMQSTLTIARRSGGLLGDADELSDSDDDDEDDDHDDDSESESESDDSAASTTWTCRICASATRISIAERTCPNCFAARPARTKSPLRARRSSKDKTKPKPKKPKKSAYGVSSDVLRTLAREPTSSKLVDTLQTLTHTLAMMDASADSEWGDMRGASLFIRGFGAATASSSASSAKDPELLDVLSDVFSQTTLSYPVDVRLLAVQSIHYVMKMDRHVFPRATVLNVVHLYLRELLQWHSDDTTSARSRSADMVVEECLNGLASVCSTESFALRELVQREHASAYVDFVARLVAADSGFHASIVATSLELLQKCCMRMRWSAPLPSPVAAKKKTTTPPKKKKANANTATSPAARSPAKTPPPRPQDSVMTIDLATKVVALLRQVLQHKHVPLHVKAAKCLSLVFHRMPHDRSDAIATLVTPDVLKECVAVVTNASGVESEDARQAMIALLFQLFDNRPMLVSLFVRHEIYTALFDGVLPLLQSTSSALGAGALKLTALLARLVCRKHSTSSAQATDTSAPPPLNRSRLNSAPDPDVLATLLLDFIRADSIPAVSALLRDGADLNFPRLLDAHGREIDKPLQVAVERASLGMVKYLIKRGADVHQLGPNGTALHVAVTGGRCDMVSFLLQCGASVHAVDRNGKTVLDVLAAASDGATALPSPVQKMLEGHRRALLIDDRSDDSDAERHGHASAGACTWFFADGEDDDDEDMDEDREDDDEDEDDAYYLHEYDDDDDEEDDDDAYDGHDHALHDDDEEISSEDDDDDGKSERKTSEDAKTTDSDAQAAPATSASKKRRIDSISSESESRSTSAAHQAKGAARREDEAQRRRQGFSATPDEIYGFSHAILACLLAVLYDMDIQNVERSVISTLACVLEMAPSQLVRALSDRDVVLVLDMVHFLLQGQKLEQAPATAAPDNATVLPTKAPSASSSSQQLKANLSSYILALRILQAIVRKSSTDSSIFYQIERRGICEQIEQLHATSSSWMRPAVATDSPSEPLHDTIFTRALALLDALRANMIESGMLHLHKLKNLARRMRALTDASTPDERELAVIDLVELFEQPNSITTYEFKQSELLPAVLEFLAPHGHVSASRATVLVRAFTRSPEALKHLVARLQSIITHEEALPVVSYNPGRGRELFPLTRQLKITCSRAPTSDAAIDDRQDAMSVGEDDQDVHDQVPDDAALAKTIHSSPLTHFQSFERTIARCLPVRDAKLSALYANLVGHCVQKVIDAKWKKFVVCGFDNARSLHLLKPIGGLEDDVVEMVLHDSQYKLAGAVPVFEHVRVDLALFGAVVDTVAAATPDASSAKGSKKKRKASNKRKRKLSLTKAQDDATQALCDVEVRNSSDVRVGTLDNAWYAASLLPEAGAKTTKPGKFETLVKPNGVYSVRLAHTQRVVHNVSGAALRKRLAAPQVGSVVDADGALGEVTKVYKSSNLVDVRVHRDIEKVRVKPDRIRYPPAPSTTADDDDDDEDDGDRIEAMSLRRMFPPRESSLIAGNVGDRVWIRPRPGAGVNDLYVAATIKSFPSGLESIREASVVHVRIAPGLDDQRALVTVKVQQEQVINFVNGARRGAGSGGSRLLAALQMASGRSGSQHDRLFGSASSSALQRAFQQATDSMRSDVHGGSDTGGGAMDQLRQLLSRVSRTTGDADALALEAGRASAAAVGGASSSLATASAAASDGNVDDAPSAAPSRTSSPVSRRPSSSSSAQKRSTGTDESKRNEDVWTHFVHDGDAEPAWICATAPRVHLCLSYAGRESTDAQLESVIASSRLGVASARDSATTGSSSTALATDESKTKALLFAAPHVSKTHEPTELSPRVRTILLDVFKTFEATPARTPSPKKKKRKLSAAAAAAVLADSDARVPDSLWDIDRFCAFMTRSIGWPKPLARRSSDSSSDASTIEQCVLFSKFATPASQRAGLAFDGFVALMAAFCREPAKAKLVLKYVRSLGYSDAHLAAATGSTSGSGQDAASKSRQLSQAAVPAPTLAPALRMREFPADQNVLKCLHTLQDEARTAAQTPLAASSPSLPPWKYLYKVHCDFRVDWQADASAGTPVAAPSPSTSGQKAKKSKRSKSPSQRASDAKRENDSESTDDADAFEWLNQDASELTTASTALSTTSVASAVRLLHYLFDLTSSSSSDRVIVPDDVWTSPRLYNKLETQLQDVLSVCSGIYPAWCDRLVTQCRFFFPRDLRERLFRATSFGCTRSLHWFRHQLQIDESASSDSVGGASGASSGIGIGGGVLNHEISITPIPKERVKVHRANILNSAEAVMKMHAKRRAVLDIVFAGEKGYGSGVTAAFYSATALALQSADENARKHLWVAGDDDLTSASAIDGEDAVIRHPNGLFPFPHMKPQTRVVERFRMIGRLAGKAIMDERILPLPLAPQFMKLIVGESVPVDDIPAIFQSPGKIVRSMRRAADALASGEQDVEIDGMDVATWLDAVAFTFIEPLSQTPLVPGGDDIAVTTANLGEYVDRVLCVWLRDGIDAQVRAFRDGISDVLPLEKLKLLFVPELLSLLCGDADIAWDTESLRRAMKLAHGYTSASAPVQFLVEFLDEMSVSERRAFLLYATGCPNLPPGGFSALKPGFEVVRRVVETDDVDRALPFARTCTNTLHLPAYSSKDALVQQMRFAIANSRGVIDRD